MSIKSNLFAFLIAIPLLGGCNNQSPTKITNPTTSDNQATSTPSIDPYAGLEGKELLNKIFESYLSDNSKIVNDSIGTEYFLGPKAYFMDYISYYNDQNYADWGLLVNGEQATFRYTIENNQIKLLDALSMRTDEAFIYDECIDSPEDLYYFGKVDPDTDEDIWREAIDYEIPDVMEGQTNPFNNNKGIFLGNGDQIKLLVGTLGHYDFEIDENTSDYIIPNWDEVLCVIKEDYSLHFEISGQGFRVVIFDIVDVNETTYKIIDDYMLNPVDKEAPKGYSEAQINAMNDAFGEILPFPTGLCSFALEFSFSTVNGGYAIISDKGCGDIVENYIKLCNKVGFNEREMSPDIMCDLLLSKKYDELSSKELWIAISYSSPTAKEPKGFFVASMIIHQ